MLVHPNITKIRSFSTQFFACDQTRQDVCTEPNKLKKISIFTTVWSSHLLSQKLILQNTLNIATWFHILFSRIIGNTARIFIKKYRLQPYYIKTLWFTTMLVCLMSTTNTLCCVVNLRILNSMNCILLFWHDLVILNIPSYVTC